MIFLLRVLRAFVAGQQARLARNGRSDIATPQLALAARWNADQTNWGGSSLIQKWARATLPLGRNADQTDWEDHR